MRQPETPPTAPEFAFPKRKTREKVRERDREGERGRERGSIFSRRSRRAGVNEGRRARHIAHGRVNRPVSGGGDERGGGGPARLSLESGRRTALTRQAGRQAVCKKPARPRSTASDHGSPPRFDPSSSLGRSGPRVRPRGRLERAGLFLGPDGLKNEVAAGRQAANERTNSARCTEEPSLNIGRRLAERFIGSERLLCPSPAGVVPLMMILL